MNALLPTLLGAVLAPALLGAGVVSWLGLSRQHGWRLFVAWSYLTGHLVQAWLTFAWAASGQPVPGWLLPVAAAGLGIALLATARSASSAVPAVRGDPWLRVVLAALLVVFAERCSVTWLHALLDGDQANIWAAKARVLYEPGGYAPWFGVGFVQHADYPMLNPLAQVLAFATSGRVLLWENRLPIQAFGAALLLLLSVVVERHLPRWLAIAALIAFTATMFPALAAAGFADVMVALALLAAMDAFWRCRATGDPAWWRLCAVALAALLASKNEGAMLGVAFAVALLLARCLGRAGPPARLRWSWLWLLLPAATLAAHQVFNATYGLANDLTSPTASDGRGLFARVLFHFPDRIVPVLRYYLGLFADAEATRWLFFALLIAPLAAGRAALQPARVWPWLVVVAGLLGYVLVFVGTSANSGGPDGAALGLQWHLETAAGRTLMHLLPAAVLALCVQLAPADASRHPATLRP